MSSSSSSNRRERVASRSTESQTVSFTFHAPRARHVCVTGDFTDWSKEGIPLSLSTDDEWKTSLRLPSGRYEYRFLVDGEWRDDPSARQTVTNAFGTLNGVVEVR
jgi:1,4-alpha-glucan branching enzyme